MTLLSRLSRLSRSAACRIRQSHIVQTDSTAISRRCSSSSSRNKSFEWSTEWINKDSSDDETLVVFLHGLLGNKRNIKSLASSICKSLQAPGLLMDVRGHGDSQLPAEYVNNQSSTFLDCVWDFDTTLHAQVPDIEDRELIIVGHSMGGRVTMLYTVTENVIKRPRDIWLLDTVPGNLSQSVLSVLEAANQVVAVEDKHLKRDELVDFLMHQHHMDLGTSQWLAAAYDPRLPGKFKFDLNVAGELVQDFQTVDFMGWMKQARTENSTGIHMIRGGANKAWETSGTLETFQAWEAETNDRKQFSFHTLPSAGHWVHIDDPKGLLEAVESVHKN